MGGAIRRFDQFEMKGWLEAKTGLPVTVENDANCVLLAERWQGKAKDIDNFLVLTIGTGSAGQFSATAGWFTGRVFAPESSATCSRKGQTQDVLPATP